MPDRTYIAIDLKSFYASVECMDRNLDPMTTNLVVADESRTEKTICLAVSPSLKAHGIPGRARLFEVIQRVRAVNADRRHRAPRGQFTGKSANAPDLQANPALELGYVVAVPRMARYMEVSAKIYSVYLKYVSPDDIHVYSIDEVFIDATSYLKLYKLTAREFAMKMIRDVLHSCLKHGRGTFYFACFDRTHLNKRLVETKAISQSISDYWAQHVMLERIQQIESRLLGEMPPNLAARLEEPYKADDLLSLNGSWYFRLDPNDSGKKRGWQNSASFGNGWTTIKVPAFWESQRIPEKFGNTASYDGIAWYAKQIILPESFRNRDLVFSVNAIDDLDETYVNGVLIGSTDETTKGYWAAPRNYRIPAELTKSGKLTVIIRVTDLRGDGGIPEPVSLIGRNSSGGTLTFPYDLETFPTYHTESAIRW